MNRHMTGWVTINTDASFRSDLKISSYAYWIRYEGAKLVGSGVVKIKIFSPDQAERAAIANALHVVYVNKTIIPIKVIINRDNVNAVNKKNGDETHKAIHKLLKDMWKKAKRHNRTTVPFDQFFEFRHVKAHSGTDEKRKWVNDWCDKEAKKVLRKHIEINK